MMLLVGDKFVDEDGDTGEVLEFSEDRYMIKVRYDSDHINKKPWGPARFCHKKKTPVEVKSQEPNKDIDPPKYDMVSEGTP